MTLLNSLKLIFSYNTIAIVLLSIYSTYICITYELYADFPLTLIGIAVVFPIVFSIGGAYSRREKALSYYSVLKAYGRAIFFAARDWVPNTDKKFQNRLKKILKSILINCRELFRAEGKEQDRRERQTYKQFSELSQFNEECRNRELSNSEVSRLNQHLSKMLEAFESMKHIYQYRTPVTLRAYSKIFIYVLPIAYGPYFANLAQDMPSALIYVIPVLFSIILVSLDNIQEHLENPFDQVGEDDVRINPEKFIRRLDL
jgi:predicted membrane chloride channel (bestrophin family)